MQSNRTEQANLRRITDHTGSSIVLNAVSKSFGTRHVLSEIDLQIAAGDFVAIIGRSGCGKSTLLRLLAGLDTASQGSTTFGGDDPDVRMMFQDARLLPWKSVLDNVNLGSKDASSRALAHAALETMGLGDRASDWPATLSGGQRQRVALARALLHAPDILLLDEPLGALDALTRIDMQQLIQTLWQRHGFTAVLVTHDVQEAIALAKRIVLIEDGRITLDLPVTLPTPRIRGSTAFAALEKQILSRLLESPASGPTQSIPDLADLR